MYSKFKAVKTDRDGMSSKMWLLHLRWQQMRLELLQQAAMSAPFSESTQNPPPGSLDKDFINAA